MARPKKCRCEPGLLSLAYELDLPIVATHDVRFMKADDAEAHDAMMCIANGAYLGQEDRPTGRRSAIPQNRSRNARTVRGLAGSHRNHGGNRQALWHSIDQTQTDFAQLSATAHGLRSMSSNFKPRKV